MSQLTQRSNRFLTRIYRNRYLYLLLFPGLVFMLVFRYLPMGGLVIAFKDYMLRRGIWGSPWVEGSITCLMDQLDATLLHIGGDDGFGLHVGICRRRHADCMLFGQSLALVDVEHIVVP